MSRYPPLPPASLNDDQLKLHNHIDSTCFKIFGDSRALPFVLKDSNESLVGPFPLLLHSPEPLDGIGVFDYIMRMTSHPLLTASQRELAILAVGAHTGCVYELYAHSLVARKIGMSEIQIKAAAEGKTPVGLDETEKAVFELAARLVSGKGPLPDDTYEAAKSLMGKDIVLVVIQLVAVYSYVCLILNAGAVGLPAEAVSNVSEEAS